MGVSNSDQHIFSKSGPSHITSIDWNDSSHRTAVIASLVNGVYVLQRLGPNAGAEPWWESFNFTLLETLVNEDDNSIYGAIFEYQDSRLELSPRYVIAFRGTIITWETLVDDIIDDIFIFFNKHCHISRASQAIEKIKTMVDKHNNKDVWLAGHSLGATVALLVGKTMIRKLGISLETYAFNPPTSSILLNAIVDNEILKSVCRFNWSIFKATLCLDHQEQIQEDPTILASWIPRLYVNPADFVCSEYIGYFRNKKIMSKIGLRNTEDVAARNTIWSCILQRIGVETSSPSEISEERLHILSSAKMIINMMDKSTKWTVAHGLNQWWERNADGGTKWKTKNISPTTSIFEDFVDWFCDSGS